jgi:hypothetical protein
MDDVTWSVQHHSLMGILSVMGGLGLILWGTVLVTSYGLGKPVMGIIVLLAGMLLAFHGVDHIHLAYLTHHFRILFPR